MSSHASHSGYDYVMALRWPVAAVLCVLLIILSVMLARRPRGGARRGRHSVGALAQSPLSQPIEDEIADRYADVQAKLERYLATLRRGHSATGPIGELVPTLEITNALSRGFSNAFEQVATVLRAILANGAENLDPAILAAALAQVRRLDDELTTRLAARASS